MTVIAPPPNPSLVAIILVIQARSGPRFVYHYPPSPLSRAGVDSFEERFSFYEDSSVSDDDITSTSDEELLADEHGRGRTKFKRADFADEEDENSSSPGIDSKQRGGWRVPWEHLLGLDASALERLLMPSDKSWHKRRFEVGFNDLVFVGWPVFIREDGTWRKKSRKERGNTVTAEDNTVGPCLEVSQNGDHATQDKSDHQRHVDLEDSPASNPDESQTDESREMTIFNVVFVLNPPVLEYSLRVREMYDHVVKKLGKALKWEQARANYVWQQSDLILKAKAQARHKSKSFLALFSALGILITI